MAQISRGRIMAAQPQPIWDVLADFGAISSWADGVDHSSMLNSGAEPLGSTRRVQVGRNALVERISTFEPPVTLAYSIEGLPRRLGRLANQWTLRPVGGGTEVTLTSSVELGSGPLGAAAARVIARVLSATSKSMLTGLARRVEKS